MRVFLSHSSKDQFVSYFVSFLTSLGINPNDIFCSSLEGQGVKNGKRINDVIRKEFIEADLIIYLISHNFLESVYCTQELGGALFVAEDSNKFFVFKFEDVKGEDIKGFIDDSYKYNLVDSEGLSSLYDSLADVFDLNNKQAVITRAINKLLEDLKKDIKVLVEEKDKSADEIEKDRIILLQKQYDDLSLGEKVIIGSIYYSEDAVGYYQLSNGTIGLLSSKHFIYRTTNLSTGAAQFAYALQPWTLKFIKNNEEVQKELETIIKEKGMDLDDDPYKDW